VLDRGGEEEDLEERDGRVGMAATAVDEEATFWELMLEEETEMAGCWGWSA
jgi:hypothetical protein